MVKGIKNVFDLKQEEKKIFFVFIIGVVFYALFALFGDVKKVLHVLRSFNWLIVIPLVILSSCNYLFRFFRWHYLLHKINIHIKPMTSARIFLSGLSMTVTPGKMGEVVKAYLLKKEVDIEYPSIIPLLIFERFTDGIGMILLAAGGLYLFHNLILLFIFFIALVVIFAAVVRNHEFLLPYIKKHEKKFGRLPLFKFFNLFFDHSERLMKPQILGVSILFSLIAWGFEGIALYILISQFGHSPFLTSLLSSLVIFSFSSIAGFLAFLPGGIGVAEGSISSLVAFFFHLPLPEVIFITILFRFVTLWFGVVIGLWNLLLSFSKH